MADAPFGTPSRLLLHFKIPEVQVGRFGWSSRTLARRSSCLHGRAVGTARYSPSRVSGWPSAKLPAGAITPRPSTGWGWTIKNRSVARLVAAIRSPPFCQARPGSAAERQGRQQPPARFQPTEERPRRTPGDRQYTCGGRSMPDARGRDIAANRGRALATRLIHRAGHAPIAMSPPFLSPHPRR